MYNRYIPKDAAYTRAAEERPEGRKGPAPQSERRPGGFSLSQLLSKGEGALPAGGVGAVLKALKLDGVDKGDILLLLIALLLLTEGDDLDLVIALGVVLLMGLGEDKGREKG